MMLVEIHCIVVRLLNDYTIDYQVTLWDHFGLDMTDIKANPNTYPFAKDTFTAWFTLQHLRGYKPFITKITFEKSFKGNIKEGKFERFGKRNRVDFSPVNEFYKDH